jgi:hypothetical protein
MGRRAHDERRVSSCVFWKTARMVEANASPFIDVLDIGIAPYLPQAARRMIFSDNPLDSFSRFPVFTRN